MAKSTHVALVENYEVFREALRQEPISATRRQAGTLLTYADALKQALRESREKIDALTNELAEVDHQGLQSDDKREMLLQEEALGHELSDPDHDTRHKEGVDPPTQWIIVQIGTFANHGATPCYQIYEHDDEQLVYVRMIKRGPNDPVGIDKARERMVNVDHIGRVGDLAHDQVREKGGAS